MAANNSTRARCDHNASLIPAVAYYRMSSDKQEASIPEQRKAVERWATANGYTINREYIDEGISGWKDQRDGFQRLIADLQRGDFQAVLCWDQNRFSRFPVLEANHYWFLLDRAGVHLATVNQGRLDWHSIAGWLTASIKQYGDAQHRHQLSADVKRGMAGIAEKGYWQGKIPLGFVVNGSRKLEPGDATEVAIVKRIFSDYVSGKSIRSIGQALNGEGHRSRDGKAFCSSTLHRILSNPAYIGTLSRGDTLIHDNHTAIIDRETFATVERKLAERRGKTTPFQNGGGYLFTGLMKCGECGSAMCGRTMPSGNRIYRCHGYEHKGAAFCNLNSVAQADLTPHVVNAIVDRFTNPKMVKRIRDELHRQVKTTTAKVNIDGTKKQLATVEGKLSKARMRLVEVDRDMLPIVQEQIRELDRQRGQLATALEAARTPANELTAEADAKVDKAMGLFSRLSETLHKADNMLLRELLAELIERVDVWSEKRKEGRQYRYHLRRGTIFLKLSNLFCSPPRKGHPASFR